MSAQALLFDEVFVVRAIQDTGFERVDRIRGVCEQYETTQIRLDVNTSIYPMHPGERYKLALATSLALPGQSLVDEGYYDPNLHHKKTLLDRYEYAMHGYIFKIEPWTRKKTNRPPRPSDGPAHPAPPRVAIYISFGGLVLYMKASSASHNLQRLEIDAPVYLLLRKV